MSIAQKYRFDYLNGAKVKLMHLLFLGGLIITFNSCSPGGSYVGNYKASPGKYAEITGPILGQNVVFANINFLTIWKDGNSFRIGMYATNGGYWGNVTAIYKDGNLYYKDGSVAATGNGSSISFKGCTFEKTNDNTPKSNSPWN